MSQDTGKHYRFSYKGINLDPARIASIYGITNMVQAGIVKKALCAGTRGHKTTLRDIDDIITGCNRWKEMLVEDQQDEIKININLGDTPNGK